MSATASTPSPFMSVVQAPPDAIFGVKNAFAADPSPQKINLSVGAYRTAQGKPFVLEVVRATEIEMARETQRNIEYAPIGGNTKFIELSQKLMFGEQSAALAEGRVAGVQALSGTGALRVAFEFIAKHLPGRKVFLPNPTWGNHRAIVDHAGLEHTTYRYYKPSTRGLDIDGLLADVNAMPRGSVFLLHACAHNPTGVDPTQEQWQQIVAAAQERDLLVLFDSAYQGYATGDLDRDAYAVRLFESSGIPLLLAQSYAKNMGLYGYRVGCLSVVCADQKERQAVDSQLRKVVRPMYSNPPRHGAEIVARVLSNPHKYAQWKSELSSMSQRIVDMRLALRTALEKRGTPGTWDHITSQIGMFSFTGLTPDQCANMISRHHIYLLSSGRISMAGLNPDNIEYMADAMHDVIVNA